MSFLKKCAYNMLGMLCLFGSSCSVVDDYVLGKDNTLKPKPLPELHGGHNIKTEWSASLGKVARHRGYLKLKPSVHAGVLYVVDPSGLVQAHDTRHGTLLWSQTLKNGALSGPSVAEGVMALGTNASSVVLLKQATGQLLWEKPLSGEVLAAPLILPNQVIVKTVDGHVYSLDLKTGEKQWVMDHGTPNLMLKASSSPVKMGDLILIGFSDGKLDALERHSGRSVWQRGVAYARGPSDVDRLVDIDADPIVRSNVIYLASYQGLVGAWGASEGEEIWHKAISVYKNMVMDASTLYVTDRHDVIWALDRANGLVKWRQKALIARGVTEPVLLGHWLVVGDETGYVHVLNALTGELVGRTSLGAPIYDSPVVSENRLYVITAHGTLHRLVVGA